jgi:hypothetical protein
MPSLADLFNPSFLMFLGILVLLVSLLVVYFESKMRDQNHKISSMLSLVSSLAEEMNSVKMGLNHLSMRGGISMNQIPQPFPSSLGQNLNEAFENNLITVSDNEESDEENDEENDEESDEESNIEEYDDASVDSDDEIVSLEEDENNEVFNEIKVLKINLNSQLNEDNIEDIDEDSNNLDFDDLDDLDNKSVSSKSSEYVDETLTLQYDKKPNQDINNQSEILDISSSEFKTININLEEHTENVDYKKFSLPKLRSIVSDKGLSSEASKLKKNDLLKLLGAE